MNGNASISQCIYSRSGSTLGQTLACYNKGSRFELNDRQ